MSAIGSKFVLALVRAQVCFAPWSKFVLARGLASVVLRFGFSLGLSLPWLKVSGARVSGCAVGGWRLAVGGWVLVGGWRLGLAAACMFPSAL